MLSPRVARLNHEGLQLFDAGHFAKASFLIRKALRACPDDPRLLCNLGIVLSDMGGRDGVNPHLDEAARCLQRSIELDPTQDGPKWVLAGVELQRGRYADGWAWFESRCFRTAHEDTPQTLRERHEWVKRSGIACPHWEGEPLLGQRLLLVYEAGFGDVVMFIRYAWDLAQRGAIVSAAVPVELLRLVQNADGVAEAFVVAPPTESMGMRLVTIKRLRSPVQFELISPTGMFDFWASMMSVPGRLGTVAQTIPCRVPYLCAGPRDTDAWRLRFQGIQGLKVGLAWSAGGTSRGDFRSMHLRTLVRLLACEGVTWLSLQKGPAEEDIERHEGRLRALGPELTDFAQTAAVIENLDLVITVDTAVAHVAGALGKPVWVMLPANPDWRWAPARDTSPWYPGMRLFRQRTLGDWAPVVADVIEALEAMK